VELIQAIKNIKHIGNEIPYKEISCIRKNKEEAIPLLMTYVSDTIKLYRGLDDWDESIDDPILALYLLAEFRVTDAFTLFADILEMESDKVEWLLSDILSEDYGGMVVSVATFNDIERIKSIIDNIKINEYQRLTAVNVLIGLFGRGIYSHGELVAFLRHLLEIYKDDDDEFVDCLVDKCYDVNARELYPQIVELFNAKKIYPLFLGKEDFNSSASARSEESVIAAINSNKCYSFVLTLSRQLKDGVVSPKILALMTIRMYRTIL